MYRKALLIILVIFSLVFFFVACGKKSEQSQKGSEKITPVTLTLFYPYDTGTDVEIFEVNIETQLKDNETALQKINHYLKNPQSQDGITPLRVLGPEAEILNVEIINESIAKVNVNQQFISQMNAGASFEEAILKSLAKTISTHYLTDGIILQVEGKPYESGHYAFGPEEVINGSF